MNENGSERDVDIDARLARVELVIFDVDGVLTDGSLFLGDGGEEYKAFNSRDGLGMKLLQATGIHIGIITGRTSTVVEHRMASLGIEHVYQGQLDKLVGYADLKSRLNLDDAAVAYVGDDVIDLPILLQAGCAIAVADAHELVIEHAHWRTDAAGGRGAAREVCERIMRARGTWQGQLDRFL